IHTLAPRCREREPSTSSVMVRVSVSSRTSRHFSDGPEAEVGGCLDIKAFSRYDDGHNLPLVVAGATVSIATQSNQG
ncbi:MAG: hypothetical protein WAV38_17800, partial [Xanthobacteraceae bacterium]